MRCRLIASVAVLVCFGNSQAQSLQSLQSEQDLSAGQLIYSLAALKLAAPETDHELRSALGSSVEFLFLQLERSKSDGARVAASQTIVLDCDAGCATSRQDAILSKGPSIEKSLLSALAEYEKLCQHKANICATKEVASKRARDLIHSLRTGSWKIKP